MNNGFFFPFNRVEKMDPTLQRHKYVVCFLLFWLHIKRPTFEQCRFYTNARCLNAVLYAGYSNKIVNQIQTTPNKINKKIKQKHKKRAEEKNWTEQNLYYAFMKWDEIGTMQRKNESNCDSFSIFGCCCCPCFAERKKKRHQFYMRIMHVGDDVEHVSSDKMKFV